MDLFQTQTQDEQSSPLDIHVPHLVLPASNEARKMTAISGRKYSKLFKQNDPLGLFARMLLDTSTWASTKCYLTWKVKPITESKHFVLELYPSMLHIEDNESGLWPTPRVSDIEGGVVKNVELRNGSYSRKNKDGVRWGVKLKDAVHYSEQDKAGSLNPQWVEWLMGYPEGWTDLED
jgi:hypothetical protein